MLQVCKLFRKSLTFIKKIVIIRTYSMKTFRWERIAKTKLPHWVAGFYWSATRKSWRGAGRSRSDWLRGVSPTFLCKCHGFPQLFLIFNFDLLLDNLNNFCWQFSFLNGIIYLEKRKRKKDFLEWSEASFRFWKFHFQKSFLKKFSFLIFIFKHFWLKNFIFFFKK